MSVEDAADGDGDGPGNKPGRRRNSGPLRGFAASLADVLRFIASRRLALLGLSVLALFTVVGVFAPYLAPYDPSKTNLAIIYQPPSAEHPFGTDRLGRDIFSRIMFGARIALLEGFVSAAIAFVVGVGIGTVAGYYNDTLVDEVLMRAMDVIFAFPLLVLALALVGSIGFEPVTIGPLTVTNLMKIIFVLTLVTVPRVARVSRGAVITEVQESYVDAKKTLGEHPLRIMFLDIQKNAVGPVVVLTVIRAGYNLIIGAGLSFLGFGIQPPKADWGLMLAHAEKVVLNGLWWVPLFPGLAILLTVIGVNMIGDAYRDYLDPSQRI